MVRRNLQYHSCFFYAAESEDFTMKLTYHQNGDYLLPNLGLTEAEQRPLGKYGRMRLRYLEEHRPVLFTQLLLSGKLMEHLQEIDSTCRGTDGADDLPDASTGGCNGRIKSSQPDGMDTAYERHPPSGRRFFLQSWFSPERSPDMLLKTHQAASPACSNSGPSCSAYPPTARCHPAWAFVHRYPFACKHISDWSRRGWLVHAQPWMV